MLKLKRSLQIGVLSVSIALSACAPESASDSSASTKQFPGQNGNGNIPQNQGTNNLPQSHWQAIKGTTYSGQLQTTDLRGQQVQSSFTISISERSLDGVPFGYVTLSAPQANLNFSGYLGLVPGTSCSATYCFLSEIKQLSTQQSVYDVSLAINLGFSQSGEAIVYVPQYSAVGFLDCSSGTSCSQVLNSFSFQLQ